VLIATTEQLADGHGARHGQHQAQSFDWLRVRKCAQTRLFGGLAERGLRGPLFRQLVIDLKLHEEPTQRLLALREGGGGQRPCHWCCLG
jgi:hypothetical protein